MWAQVPNWKSGDPLWIKRAEPVWTPPPRVPGAPRAHRPARHEPEKLDWFEALLTVDLNELEQPFAFEEMPKVELPPVPADQREALRQDALAILSDMHALAATHRADAVEPLFRLAFTMDGVFRDECGRQIRDLGEPAIAPLVRLQYAKGTPQLPGNKQRRYAVYQLDRMDRARPQKALDTAPDDWTRAEIIRAYGEVRALDAVEAVLELVNASSHRVRREARIAFRRYVEGPSPPPAPKRKRKLPGGKEESEEKPDYLTYREVAELALGKKLVELAIEAPPHATPLALYEALVAHYDAEGAAEWERVYAGAQAREAAGDVSSAIDQYEGILAHDPTNLRRAEMAPSFARFAEQRAHDGHSEEAAGLYRKAAALTPVGSPEARRYEAEAELLDAARAEAHGKVDEAALRRVLALAPEHEHARATLARLESARRSRLLTRVATAAGLIGLLLFAGALFALRPRRVPEAS